MSQTNGNKPNGVNALAQLLEQVAFQGQYIAQLEQRIIALEQVAHSDHTISLGAEVLAQLAFMVKRDIAMTLVPMPAPVPAPQPEEQEAPPVQQEEQIAQPV